MQIAQVNILWSARTELLFSHCALTVNRYVTLTFLNMNLKLHFGLM